MGGEREECAWGISCWYAVDGRCRRVHTAEQEAHFEAKRRLLEVERQEDCGFCKLGRCRYGEQCRRRQSGGGSDRDSDYSETDGEGIRRAGGAGDLVGEERRSSGGAQLEEAGFVPPKPGVFPPKPRPRVVARMGQRDGRGRNGAGHERWGGSEGSWETMDTDEKILEAMGGDLEKPEVIGGAASGGVDEGVEGSRGGEEEEGDEGCLEGTGGFEGPVDFRMGQVEEKRGRVARRKQVAGQEGEGGVVGDGEEIVSGSPAGTPNFLRDSGEVSGGGGDGGGGWRCGGGRAGGYGGGFEVRVEGVGVEVEVVNGMGAGSV